MADLLSQEEIDALLKGVDDNDIAAESDEIQDKESASYYDFRSQERIVRRRIPALEMINERFSKNFRASLFKFLHRSPEVFILGIKIQKYSEYVKALRVPINLNTIRFSPLRGRALIVIEPSLIFTVVDNFFGGGHVYSNATEGREFTLTEMRIVRMLIDIIFNNLKQAWDPVMPLNFEYIGSEINPHFANIVGSESDIVVISTLNVTFEAGGGDINIVMPYAMIEPIRALLDAVGNSNEESDAQWRHAIRTDLQGARVRIDCLLMEKQLTIKEILDLKKNDVIPIDKPKTVLLKVEGIPVFTGNACTSDGYYAVQIVDKFRPESS